MELKIDNFLSGLSFISAPEVITSVPAVLTTILGRVGGFEPLDKLDWVLEDSPQPGLGSLYL